MWKLHFVQKHAGRRQGVTYAYRTPERFWALPQSPQQYKQLLMVAGLIDTIKLLGASETSGRADRQPEFTQLDIEMLVDANDVIVIVESVVQNMVNASHCILDEYEKCYAGNPVFQNQMINQAMTIMSATLDNIMIFLDYI